MTIAILALLTLLEGVRRVPRGALVLQRMLIGSWHVPTTPPARDRVQLLSWWSPLASAIVLPGAGTGPRWTAESLRARLRTVTPALIVLRALGLLTLLVLVIGIPLAFERLNATGFGLALGALALLCIAIFAVMLASARHVERRGKAAWRWAVASLSPFGAPRAAEALLEEVLRAAPAGLVARVLLPPDDFLRWVRPYAYDAGVGRDVDGSALAGLDLRELQQTLDAPAAAAGLWCPRCGATFVHGTSCSECDIALAVR